MWDFKYMDTKNIRNLLKSQIFFLFSEALSVCNQFTNKNTDSSAA